nr:hypothetical protein [Tanacetum cinerariifolium]
MPTGKIGVYTRFFEYANFRLTLFTFFVNVPRYNHIHISQLSVIVAAKVSHFEILCRVQGFEPTVGLLFERLERPFFWVEAFACPASFPWHTSKSVSRDVIPKSSEFNAEHYAALVAYPTPFHKYLEPFLCLPVSQTEKVVAKDVLLLQPMRQKKRKTVITGASEPSHPSTKLREGHKTLNGASMGGKSRFTVQRLLARAVRNAEVQGGPIPTLLFVITSVSATSEREGEGHTDSAEVDSFSRPFAPIITTAIAVTSIADPAAVTKETIIKPYLFFAGSAFGGGTGPAIGGFADLSGSDFLIGGIRTVVSLDTDLQRVFFASIYEMQHGQLFTEFDVGAARQMPLSAEVRMHAEYNIRERRRLKSAVEEKDTLLKIREKEIRDLRAQLLVKEAKAAETIRLRAEAFQFEVVEKSIRDEVQALTDRNVTLEKEKGELDVKAADLAALFKVREQEVANLDVVVTSVKLQNDNLADQVHKLETSYAGLQEKSRHMRTRFYPELLTTIFGRRWLLTYGLELAITKFLNSTEYLSTLKAAIGKVVEKGVGLNLLLILIIFLLLAFGVDAAENIKGKH